MQEGGTNHWCSPSEGGTCYLCSRSEVQITCSQPRQCSAVAKGIKLFTGHVVKRHENFSIHWKEIGHRRSVKALWTVKWNPNDHFTLAFALVSCRWRQKVVYKTWTLSPLAFVIKTDLLVDQLSWSCNTKMYWLWSTRKSVLEQQTLTNNMRPLKVHRLYTNRALTMALRYLVPGVLSYVNVTDQKCYKQHRIRILCRRPFSEIALWYYEHMYTLFHGKECHHRFECQKYNSSTARTCVHEEILIRPCIHWIYRVFMPGTVFRCRSLP